MNVKSLADIVRYLRKRRAVEKSTRTFRVKRQVPIPKAKPGRASQALKRLEK